jgi:hypothetical protein
MLIFLVAAAIIFAIAMVMTRLAKGKERASSKWREYAFMAAALLGSLLMFRFGQTPIGSFLLFLFFFSPFAPYIRSWFTGKPGSPSPAPPPQSHAMSKLEARQILGLMEGATPQQIRAAHKRLIAKNHPDQGGTEHLASQINRARDVLLDKS